MSATRTWRTLSCCIAVMATLAVSVAATDMSLDAAVMYSDTGESRNAADDSASDAAAALALENCVDGCRWQCKICKNAHYLQKTLQAFIPNND